MTSTQNVYFIGIMLFIFGGLAVFVSVSLRQSVNKGKESIEAHSDPAEHQKVVTHYKVSNVDAENGVVPGASISTLTEWTLLNKHGRLLQSTPSGKYRLNSAPIGEKRTDTSEKKVHHKRGSDADVTRAHDSNAHGLMGVGLGLAMLNSSDPLYDDDIHSGLLDSTDHSVDNMFDNSITGCSALSAFDDVFSSAPTHSINPASGLMMVNDCIDVGGNMFGTNSMDSTFDDPLSSSSIGSVFDDSFSSSAFDDSFGSSSFGISSDPFD
ncbi:hypothetical protein [Vibrio sp. Vb0301]|uniref:hypothetical protein n=1 Tax=Vibrio sp. Vb0301 TaxID=3074622 RepID=UPI002963F6E4|nr:hypothetical protein [Vibrio sp. Vb0301]MDW2009927.1 hypothetical protein [Vibrio sp. Vb0301]